MFKNYLKIAFRKMKHQKIYAFINILGLAIGMAGAMFILLWVHDEQRYDRFHENTDRIYRVYQVFNYGDYHLEQTQTPSVLAARLKEDCPEVKLVTRVRDYREEYLVKADNRKFNEKGLGIADASFFQLFSFPLITGDPATVLAEPFTVAISEKAARKYFGDKEAVGRTLNIFDQDYVVSGVFKDMPNQSHFHLDVLCSFASFERYQQVNWGINVFKTYVLLKESSQREALESKLTDIVKNHMFTSRERYESVIAKGDYTKFLLQPLTDIHLNSNLLWEFEVNGNRTYVRFFTIIAVFILLIAGINYMNLSTARSAGRAKEVGIRKTVGSTRRSLIRQFLLESIFMSLTGWLLSIVILIVLMPVFRILVGKPWLHVPFFDKPMLLLPLVITAGLIGWIAGVYPAFFLSSFKPAAVMSGKLSKGMKRSGLRSSLVVFQFSLSVLLLVSTLVVQKQMHFIQEKNLGYKQEEVIVVQTYGELDQKLEVLKETIGRNPSVVSLSASSSVPGKEFDNIGMGLEGTNSSYGTNMYIADADFLETLEMEMVEGRFFSEKIPTDEQAVILNESMAHKLAENDLLSKRMKIWVGGEGQEPFNIIGIIRDFHYESFHETIKPLVIVKLNGLTPWPEAYLSIRVRTGNIRETLKTIREAWETVLPGTPFEYTFLDSIYNAQYWNEVRTGQVFTIFTLFAIFVACLGLLGLASFAVEQRTKEIGIRKVLGATAKRLIMLLSGEFVRWIVLANLIAWPLAFWIMSRWLRNFVYRTEIGIWPFVFSTLIMLGVTVLTVGYHSVKAVLANPVKSLRYE